MSHNYYFHCLDCHSTGEMENQRLAAMRELCRDVKELGVAARALLKAAERTPYLALFVFQDPLPLTWLAEHGDHNVKAISDYGAIDGECYRSVTCGTCEQTHPCRRPTGHEGACSPKRDEERKPSERSAAP